MGNKHLNLLGERFGQLTVIKELPYRINKFNKREYMWLCKCDCGETIEECTHYLRQGCVVRCRKCYLNDNKGSLTHGESKERLYRIWLGIKQRCYNPNNPDYINYGKRGIMMCEEWKNNYIAFKKWSLSNGYYDSDKISIDRIDNNRGYFPDNCRWASPKQQVRNRRGTLMCIYRNEVIPLAEAAERLGVAWWKLHRKWRHINEDKDVTTIDLT